MAAGQIASSSAVPEFSCVCGYKAADLTKAMAHARNTGHSLTRPADNEGTTVTISIEED